MVHASMVSESDRRLKEALDRRMALAPSAIEEAELCLQMRRWEGKVVLMVLDAAFTSVGLQYFSAVVPAVERFRDRYYDDLLTLGDLEKADAESLRFIWKNRRSWHVAQGMASVLSNHHRDEGLGLDSDRQALASWASRARPEHWKDDPIGRIKGVGLATFQYLRMMGGVDTAMPDKIVRREISALLQEAGRELKGDGDLALIEAVYRIGQITGYNSAEICWMCWLL
jgi:hypothetical protein